jgi:hypothetical protein
MMAFVLTLFLHEIPLRTRAQEEHAAAEGRGLDAAPGAGSLLDAEPAVPAAGGEHVVRSGRG